MQRIVIVNYGMGNLHSVKKRLDSLKVESVISSDYNEILSADKLILPGVGHFAKAMENLQNLGLIDALNEAVLVRKTPVLGICLGMQLMSKFSEEGNVEGLGWIDATVIRFSVSNTLKYKVPHTGWNQIISSKDSKLMSGIVDGSEFYFVHSYFMQLNDKSDELNATEYEENFSSAVEKGTIFGVQYHPEKSHGIGKTLLKNFVEL